MGRAHSPARSALRLRRSAAKHALLRAASVWAVAIVCLVALVLLILGPLAWLIAGNTVRSLSGVEQAEAINAVRQTLLTAFGGASALVALGFTVRSYYLSKRGQVTERFSRAVEQLASDLLTERLGGVHSLEHIMAESATDHTAVIGVLCAFVRERNRLRERAWGEVPGRDEELPARTEPDADIDAVMTVLARRPKRPEPNRPDLRDTSLIGLSVRSMDFAEPPRLTRMFFTGSDLRYADFRGAVFAGTIANFANFGHASLGRADLGDASFDGVDFRGAFFTGAVLNGTMLEGADLRAVHGLTASQLAVAVIDEETKVADDLAADPWFKERLSDCQAWRATHPDPWACPPPTPEPS